MYPDALWRLIEKYRAKGVLVDSNLLLLYFIGRYDRKLVSMFKRTNAYAVEEFELLARLLALFRVLVTTPNILTEVSNLAGQLPDRVQPSYFQTFRDQLVVLDEQYVSSASACRTRFFERFGLTDSVIAEAARNGLLVLTADLALALLLEQLGIDLINFNHIRHLAWTE